MRNRVTVSRAATKIGEGTGALCLHLQVRSERNAVSSFTLDPSLACFIVFLARRSVNYRSEQRVVDFKRLGEMVRNMRGQYAVSNSALSALWPLPMSR